MVQVLCRRRKNNPLLVGDAGVGKTALAEGLAQRVVEGEVPEILKDAVIYSLDMGTLLAGAKFRGDFEQRLKRVIQSLEKKAQLGNQPILFIDEIHTIIGAGAVSGGALDAANMLKPFLSQGEIKCIGSTTHQEFRNVFEKDHALARRFQKIDVVEPSLDETIKILDGLKKHFEKHHQVEYTPEAIRSSAELASKHLVDRKLPDKAIDVMDEAGARARLKHQSMIDTAAIEEVIALMARIPARSVNTSQKTRLKNLDRDLKLSIFGQNEAVDALTSAIRLARSGLRTGDRPIGCFLFCGPTGVGKTELSKQLAHCMGVPFQRFDMSEYSEKHTVSRLIGAPPGYVGFEQAGMLTDALLKNPHSVVLLDEIEKAHSDIWNILLQVMDNGFLTDNNGRKADFRNSVLIMTSNVGSREFERKPLGFSNSDNGDAKTHAAKKAVESTFSPEFRNRLDSIVFFHSLDPMVVAQVVGKQLLELESLLLAKNVEIEFCPEVRDWLAEKGYDKTMGARPLARLIQDKIKRPLAEEILFGKLENGGHVRVVLKEGELSFEIVAKALPAPKSSLSEEDFHSHSQIVN
jgi:ATP-dependent Clp protease ATP-binding subunit ClpA